MRGRAAPVPAALRTALRNPRGEAGRVLRRRRAASGRGGSAGIRSALFLLAALAAACGLASLLPETFALTREGLARGELWRLWTGHLVHLDLRHGIQDAALVAILLSIVRPWRWLLLAAPALSVSVLALRPDLESYAGLSGLAHGLALLAAVSVAREQTGMRRLAAGLLALAVPLKALLETTRGTLLLPGTATTTGIPVLEAHALGTLFGALALVPAAARAMGLPSHGRAKASAF